MERRKQMLNKRWRKYRIDSIHSAASPTLRNWEYPQRGGVKEVVGYLDRLPHSSHQATAWCLPYKETTEAYSLKENRGDLAQNESIHVRPVATLSPFSPSSSQVGMRPQAR